MYLYHKEYDVIVIGSGHAGIEASLASARIGASTLLLTINADTIGQMSCNPAIGGIGKGHLVREIDALGGEMGKATDYSGVQFRMLNTKKGPSVWSPRAQCDKRAYQQYMKLTCESQLNLDVKQARVVSIEVRNSQVHGVLTSINTLFRSKVVIVTTGTFLRGMIHIGSLQQTGGRMGESAEASISASLSKIGIRLERLKTGTPPRLLRKTINFSLTTSQNGDDPPPFFSYWKSLPGNNCNSAETQDVSIRNRSHFNQSMLTRIGHQLECHLTHTTIKTKQIVNASLHKSPLYSGSIVGIGPRYCPSIEDKYIKFPDKEFHQIYLEPEGHLTDEIYVNGLSTSFPFDVQVDLVRSIVGCENAEILRPAYAVEYDFSPPTQLHPWLETKVCQNLFLAGQINGTSGYEEAAAQGIIAGINGALRVSGKAPIMLRRDQGYIGVLIDDLVTKGTTEPYRMFTSRSEHRLLLRQDNADLRLSGIGYQIGLLSREAYQACLTKQEVIASEIIRLKRTRCNGIPAEKLLRRPNVSYKDIFPGENSLPVEIQQLVETHIKYEGYIHRQETEVNRTKSLESKRIPQWFNYSQIEGLRIEAKGHLSKIRPSTLGQASRIPGVTPADISTLAISLRQMDLARFDEHPGG